MDEATQSNDARFAAYVEYLVQVLGHADPARPFEDYCAGPVLAGERKSGEPMAALVLPAPVSAEHQSLLTLSHRCPSRMRRC